MSNFLGIGRQLKHIVHIIFLEPFRLVIFLDFGAGILASRICDSLVS